MVFPVLRVSAEKKHLQCDQSKKKKVFLKKACLSRNMYKSVQHDITQNLFFNCNCTELKLHEKHA